MPLLEDDRQMALYASVGRRPSDGVVCVAAEPSGSRVITDFVCCCSRPLSEAPCRGWLIVSVTATYSVLRLGFSRTGQKHKHSRSVNLLFLLPVYGNRAVESGLDLLLANC